MDLSGRWHCVLGNAEERERPLYVKAGGKQQVHDTVQVSLGAAGGARDTQIHDDGKLANKGFGGYKDNSAYQSCLDGLVSTKYWIHIK